MPARRSLLVMIVGASVLGSCNRTPVGGAGAGAGASAGATPSASAGATASASAGAGTGAEVDGGFMSAAGALQPSTVDAGALRALTDTPRGGTAVDIPAGSFPSGSTPGDEGRDPSLEPALMDATLGAFAIDTLPFPNDPALPFKTGVSLDEASRLCRDRGARLCTELEWERACKGPDNDTYATGARWNVTCDKERARCASGSGVRAMGTMPELTDSRFATADGSDGPGVVRGGSFNVDRLIEPTTRRCAARSKAGGQGAAGLAETGFRCCKGAASAARVAAIAPRQAFKKAGLDPAQLAKIFEQVPELARLGSDLRYFTEGDVRAMTARTGATHEGITFMTAPILWSPESGAELLVATGRGKSMSFVVALWTIAGDRYRFASSFLMLNDLSPVALAFESSRRKELRWTSCWGCPGEQGTVSYRPDDHRVVIVQQ